MNQQRRYRYELRSSSATLATGHLTQPEPLEVGDMIEIGGSAGIIRAVEPIPGEHELRLVVQLVSTLDNSETQISGSLLLPQLNQPFCTEQDCETEESYPRELLRLLPACLAQVRPKPETKLGPGR